MISPCYSYFTWFVISVFKEAEKISNDVKITINAADDILTKIDNAQKSKVLMNEPEILNSQDEQMNIDEVFEEGTYIIDLIFSSSHSYGLNFLEIIY